MLNLDFESAGEHDSCSIFVILIKKVLITETIIERLGCSISSKIHISLLNREY